MRVDFDQVIHNFAGFPLKIDDETVTLKYVAVTALLGSYPDERDLAGAEKSRRYLLAKAIHGGTANPSDSDLELIKDLAGKAFVPLIAGAAHEMLTTTPPSVPRLPVPACAACGGSSRTKDCDVCGGRPRKKRA